MILEYMQRAWNQMMRFKFRNFISFVGIMLTVLFLTMIITLFLNMNSLFSNNTLPFNQKLQLITASGVPLTESTINKVADIEEVNEVFPTTQINSYPWVTISHEDEVLKNVRITYYDPSYLNAFNDTNLIKTTGLEENGILLSEEFKDEGMIGETLTFSIDHSRVPEQYKELPARWDAPVSVEFEEDTLMNLPSLIAVPLSYQSNFTISSEPEFSTLYVKAESVQSVPRVSKELESLGFRVFSRTKFVEKSIEARQQTLKQLLIIAVVILIVAISGVVNTVVSTLREREQEIGIMKAVGASSTQVQAGIIAETLLLLSLAASLGVGIILLISNYLKAAIRNKTINPSYYEGFSLDQSSVLHVLHVPSSVYVIVVIAVLGVCIGVTSITVYRQFQKNNHELLTRGG